MNAAHHDSRPAAISWTRRSAATFLVVGLVLLGSVVGCSRPAMSQQPEQSTSTSSAPLTTDGQPKPEAVAPQSEPKVAATPGPDARLRDDRKEEPPPLTAPLDGASLAVIDRVITHLYSEDQTKYDEAGFLGYSFGASRQDLTEKLKKPAPANKRPAGKKDPKPKAGEPDPAKPARAPISNWLETVDGAYLCFEGGRLVGASKKYDYSVAAGVEALTDKFGTAAKGRVMDFDSVLRLGGKTVTGRHVLARYCPAKTVIYGFVSSGDPGNFVKPFLLVSCFDRGFVEAVIRKDLEHKLLVAQQAKPVIAAVLGQEFQWDKIPFPKLTGCTVRVGRNVVKENVATLEGRLGPSALSPLGAAFMVVREQRRDDRRIVEVLICFNCDPSFQPNKMLGPYPGARENQWWNKSLGNWSIEQDAQLANALLMQEVLAPKVGQVEVRTVDNTVIQGMDPGAHKAFLAYSWKTADGLQVEVLGNNTVRVSWKEVPTIK